jgi:hypothetical protein
LAANEELAEAAARGNTRNERTNQAVRDMNPNLSREQSPNTGGLPDTEPKNPPLLTCTKAGIKSSETPRPPRSSCIDVRVCRTLYGAAVLPQEVGHRLTYGDLKKLAYSTETRASMPGRDERADAGTIPPAPPHPKPHSLRERGLPEARDGGGFLGSGLFLLAEIRLRVQSAIPGF